MRPCELGSAIRSFRSRKLGVVVVVWYRQFGDTYVKPWYTSLGLVTEAIKEVVVPPGI